MQFERVQRLPEKIEPVQVILDDPAERVQKVPRDGHGRPKVFPPEGGKRKAYARCTTFVGCLEDQYTVHLWQQRMTAIGLLERPDLLLSVAAARDDRDELNHIVEQAREAAKANTGAITGTALHKLCEQNDMGEDPYVPPAYQADIGAYREATKYFEMSVIERFCVEDKYKIGGTPDRVIKFLGRYYIGDIKTGSIEFGQLKFAMQFAVYAHSRPYYWEDAPKDNVEVTRDVAEALRGEWPGEVDLSRALLIHLPQGEGRCDVYWVNISDGWEAVKVAASVRAWRNHKYLITEFDMETEYARAAIREAKTIDQVREIYKNFVNAGNPGECIIMDCRMKKVELLGE